MNDQEKQSSDLAALYQQMAIELDGTGTLYSLWGITVRFDEIGEEQTSPQFNQLVLAHLISLDAARNFAQTTQITQPEIPAAETESGYYIELSPHNENEIPVDWPDWIALTNLTVDTFINELSQKADLSSNQTLTLFLYSRMNEFEKAARAIGSDVVKEHNRGIKDACIDTLHRLVRSNDGIVRTMQKIIDGSRFTEDERVLLRDRLYKDYLTAYTKLQEAPNGSTMSATSVLWPFYESYHPNIIKDLMRSQKFNDRLASMPQAAWIEFEKKYNAFFQSNREGSWSSVYYFIRKQYDSYTYPKPETFVAIAPISSLLLPPPNDK